jgi:hypothetical protein
MKKNIKGAAQGAYENPAIIQDADGAKAAADALGGITSAIQAQAVKKPEDKDEPKSGSPRMVNKLRNTGK